MVQGKVVRNENWEEPLPPQNAGNNPKCPSVHKWINKQLYSYNGILFSNVKEQRMLQHGCTSKMLSERSQTQIPFI